MTLAISGLTVRYGSSTALDALELTVPGGELFVLLGGSGSGKTTLLRAIAGFVKPQAGRIALDGADLVPLPPHRRPVNTMFQSYALFPHMTVEANIAFGLRKPGMTRATVAARVAEMLALVRLDGFGQRRPDQLSGGQQQRVALARSLAPNPSLLLLDEPLSALDQGLRGDTRAELVRLQRRLGTSFILVTHDQEEALTMADRIGVMAGGRLAQVGTPAEVYECPSNRFVATFLGAANILTGVLHADGTFVVPSLNARIMTTGKRDAGPALLGLRPERLAVSPTGAMNAVEGVLTEQAYGGDSLTYTVRLPDGSILRANHALRDGFAPARLTVGDSVTLGWQPEAGMLLPP
jgi:spermidine/putrescine ABC transporter ATP-binding subunit